MARGLFVLVASGLGILALVIFLSLFLQLRRLAAEVGVIATRADLDRVKSVIKTQMIAVLLLFPMGAAPIVLWMWMVATHQAVVWDHVAVILYGAVFHGSTSRIKAVEAGLRSLPVRGPGLEGEYNDAVEAWRHQALPPW